MGEENNSKYNWKCKICGKKFRNRLQIVLHAIIKHKKIDWLSIKYFARCILSGIIVIPYLAIYVIYMPFYCLRMLADKYLDLMRKILDKIF